MKKLYNFIFLLCTAFLFAQVPSNDTCGNALAVALPGSGSVCFNSSNLNATSDNSTNACDTGAAGNEVWYTFIASNANNTITITPNGATPITDAVVTLITSGCAAGTYDVCNAATGSNPAITTLGLTPGTQVWFSVESNGTDGTFQVCIDSTPPAASPGNTCATATNICDKSNISVPDLTGFTASGVQPACFGAAVRKDVWVQFTVGVTGTLEFMGTPIAADEYDWALYNVTSGCLGTLVSCNYNYATGGPMSCGTPGAPFGMLAVTTGQLCPAEFNAPITVTAGQTYALLIDNFSQTNNGFDLQWGGTFQMGTAAIFTVDPQSSCSVPLTVNITNNSVGAVDYLWNFGDGTTSTLPNPGTHTYTSTGDYLISLTVTGNGCTSVISQRVNLNAGPVISVTPPSATICPGENVLLNANLSLGTPYNDRQFSSAVNTAIPNDNAIGLVVNQNSTGMINTTLTPGSVQSICFTINHTNHSDIGRGPTPDAVRVTVNGNSYNFTPLPLAAFNGTRTYCFPQTVLDAIAAAGGPSNTTWTLKVADNRGGGGGTGSLVSWQVTLRDFNSILGYSWSPTTDMINSTTLSPTVSPSVNTTYILSATDLFGCTTQFSVPIVIGGGPAVPTITTTAPTCLADGFSQISNYVGGIIYTFTPAGPTVDGAGMISGMVLGTSYTVTAGNGTCTSVASASFTNLAQLTVPVVPTVSVTAPTCSADGFATVTNYVGGLTYVFTPAGPTVDGSGLISNMTIGTNYVVSASNGSCASADSSSFAIAAMLITPAVPTITTTAPTCLADGFSQISNYVGGIIYTFTPAGPTVDGAGMISGMVLGTSYTVTAGNGTCTSVASASFTNLAQLTVPVVPTVSVTAPTCSADGFATVTNYVGGLTYVFTPAGPTVDGSGLISNMTIGTNYVVSASNGSCASADSSSFAIAAMLITPAVPTITTTAPTCLADGFSQISNYVGGIIYTFTPAGPTVDGAGMISGMVLGTSYTVTAGNGTCTSVASASFTNLAQLTVPVVPTVSVTAPTCSADGFATVTNYAGGLTYVFTPAGPTVDGSGLISNMTIGTNYVVSASNGSCASADSSSFAIAAMLITPAVPTITTTAPTCLADGFSQISNYVGGTIYTFTPAGPTVDGAGMISGMVLGTSYTVTAGNGTCTSVASASFTNLAQLTVPVVPTVSVTAPTCSADGFATVTNYVGGLTYVFTPAGPTVDGSGLISNMTIGTNYVVSASNGSCASADSSSFAIAAMLITPAVPTITTTAPTCLADGFSQISNYVGGIIYTFTPAGPTVDGAGMISGMVLGTSYTVTAGNGTCTSVASASFTNLAQLTVPVVPTVSVTAPTCSADGFATVTNYVGGLTYVFTPAGPTVDGSGLISNMTIGTNYVVSASNGSCASADSSSFAIAAMLITPAVPTITTTAPTCLADGFSQISNYVGGIIYTFTPAGPTVDGAGMISGMVLGTSYTVTAGNGTCTSVASASFTNLAQLTVPVVPTVSVTAPTCSADGFATVTNYVGGLTYVFTPAGPTVDGSGLISNMTIGTNYVVSASNGSCTSADSSSFAIVAMLATPAVATVTVTQPSCATPTATILVVSPIGANLEYSINNGVSYQTSTSFSGLAPSSFYTIIVRDVDSGCISNPTSNISTDAVPSSPVVTLSSGCNGSSYEIVASTTSSLATYEWYNGSTLIGSAATVVVSVVGTYQVDVTVDGCTTTEFITIDNVTCSIPKGISPNGDGLNDTWDISGLNARKVQIFNRYGVEVYSRPNYTSEFEGKTNNGNELPTGTYYYVITLDTEAKTGWLYINRAQ
jgi:gliding motility-associated-like protein